MRYFLVCLSVAAILSATPENPVVVSGDVSFVNSAHALEVTASDRAIVEWQRFSIDAGETVRFLQPSTAAVVLNRVTGTDVSALSGTLQSNGIVYLINPRGVIVGAGAVVDTAGFLATTLDVGDGQFLAGGDVLFSGSSDATVVQLGTIRAHNGDIVLMAHAVRHEGTLEAHNGSVALVAGHEVLVKPAGMPLLTIRPDLRALSVENLGSIEALNAYVLSDGISRLGALRQEGEISLVQKGGKIMLSNSTETAEIAQTAKLIAPEGTISVSGGDNALYNNGTLDVSGDSGGTITITGNYVSTGSTLLAEGHNGPGGTISTTATSRFFEIRAGHSSANGTAPGGMISISAPHLGSGATYEAAAGEIRLLGDNVLLTAANVSANKITLGGSDASALADEVYIDPWTTLSGNQIQIWAAETLHNFASSGTPFPSSELIDPNAGSGFGFGSAVVVLSNGNIVVTKPQDDIGVNTSVGSVFLYDGHTGGLPIYTLSGSNTADTVGIGGITTLSNNSNFVVGSSSWNGGTGAATWVSGTSSGTTIVSTSNSLVGSLTTDVVAGSGVFALANNGNYVVSSVHWNTNIGAATWGNGTTGVAGTVSAANSLIGSTSGDFVSNPPILTRGVVPLTNGHYVVASYNWTNPLGPIINVGAATWGNGTTGITGTISVGNSLIDTISGDTVSSVGIFALANGHYVVASPGAIGALGAATWGNGTTGITGTVSLSNSLTGSIAGDAVSSEGVVPLISNSGHYVVRSTVWNGNQGAATWGNGTTGTTGTVSASNSLVGTAGDEVSFSTVAPLVNGHYVVGSEHWNSNRGAATWGNGTTGVTGTVSAANSLIGSTAGIPNNSDRVGTAITPLLVNGNYVVLSMRWHNGGFANAGAATWGNGTMGVTGTVSSSNSLVGSTTNDTVGKSITRLTNGSYVTFTNVWQNGSNLDAGAATWGNGTGGVTGTISASNSLVGTAPGDDISGGGVFALSGNGNYVVSSASWNSNIGAATWGSGTTGITGTISISNSLIGSTVGDQVSSDSGAAGIVALQNGNYVVGSFAWTNPSVNGNVGAATWGNGTTGIAGTVSASNSLIGTTANDNVSLGSSHLGTTALANNHYVVASTNWQDVAMSTTSAATYGDSATGITGTVTIDNSLVDLTGNGGGGLDLVLDNPAVPGTFVVRFSAPPAVFIGEPATPPPPPPPSPSPSTPAHDDASARTQFRRAIAESFYDWNTRLFGPYLSNDPWPPLYTAKGLLVNLPSLVLDDPWETHTLLQETAQ